MNKRTKYRYYRIAADFDASDLFPHFHTFDFKDWVGEWGKGKFYADAPCHRLTPFLSKHWGIFKKLIQLGYLEEYSEADVEAGGGWGKFKFNGTKRAEAVEG